MIRISDVMLKFGGAIQQTAPNPNDSNVLIEPHALLQIPQRSPIGAAITPTPGQTLAASPTVNDSFQCWNTFTRANQANQYTYMCVLGVGLWEIDWFATFNNNGTAADSECGAFRIEFIDPGGAGSLQANAIALNAGLGSAKNICTSGNFRIVSNKNIAFSATCGAAAVGATALTAVLIQGHKLI